MIKKYAYYCKESIILNEKRKIIIYVQQIINKTVIKIKLSINNLLIKEIIKRIFNYEDKFQIYILQ